MIMQKLLAMVSITTLFMGAQVAFADDAANATAPMPTAAQKHQMMKDCMAKKASMNDGMSRSDMKKSCMDEMKAQTDVTATVGHGGPDKPDKP